MHTTIVHRARTHNLKNVSLELRPGELVAFTGPSGAGKTSLAMDTLYAEGQRRFVESFSPYARQFLERLDRPPADSVEPISAAIAVDRRAPIKSSRSTVATMAELEPYFAALFTSEALPVCPQCNVVAEHADAMQSARRALKQAPQGVRALVTYPVRVQSAENYLMIRERLVRDGVRRLRISNDVRDIDEIKPSEVANSLIEVVLDRVQVNEDAQTRVREAVERAWAEGQEARLIIEVEQKSKKASAPSSSIVRMQRGLACPTCARTFEPAKPGLFSYNNPLGACSSCRGFGRTLGIDWSKVIPDENIALEEGAIRAWTGSSAEWERGQLKKFCKAQNIPMNIPYRDLSEVHKKLILESESKGDEKTKFWGVRAWFRWLESRTYKMHVRVFLARYRSYDLCQECQGKRLNQEARMYQVGELDLPAWHQLSVHQACKKLEHLHCSNAAGIRVREVLLTRLRYLEAVGLGHLMLDRSARSLSGGEAQRVGLTAALGTSLVGALFVVDEPTVGLHTSDIPPLVDALKTLARVGNSVVVVEHDPHVIAACDRVIEFGPEAGLKGGQILFDGTPEQLAQRLDLPTGRLLSGAVQYKAKSQQRLPKAQLCIRNAHAHNLKKIDIPIPLGVLCVVTGPSGSGKSTLVSSILARAVARTLGNRTIDAPLEHDGIDGIEKISRIVHVDQNPLGRTSRGNAATYTKAWDALRTLLAAQGQRNDGRPNPPASYFSFNVDGGRCAACAGEGFENVEMQFLADVAIRCAVCKGQRFKDEILQVQLEQRNVAQILESTVDEILQWAKPLAERTKRSSAWSKIVQALTPLAYVGLGYLPLGQPLSTLSGGEAQRIKLARALVEVGALTPKSSQSLTQEGVLLIVDEPSAGLHAQDMTHVIQTLQRLVDVGVSVIVVEHDLNVIAAADYILDLGPGGGSEGGELVAQGSVAQVASSSTQTGKTLSNFLNSKFSFESKTVNAFAKPSDQNRIEIHHASEHNLKDITTQIPREQFIVVTGPSGSGKSTLAFDVVFAEGQRRFLETLSPYARQFLPTLPRPNVESVIGVPPAIALEQRTTRGGSTSTVATVTEVSHYLRLLYAKVGVPYCPKCDVKIATIDATTLYERIQKLAQQTSTQRKAIVLAPVIRSRKGTHLDVFTKASRAGYTEARVDGAMISIEPPPKLARHQVHTIELVVAHLGHETLSPEKLNQAIALADGHISIVLQGKTKKHAPLEQTFSTRRACPSCGLGIPEFDPRWFSFNTAQGRCPTCEGSGVEVDKKDETIVKSCSACNGERLAPIPRRVRVAEKSYGQLTQHTVDDVLNQLPTIQQIIFEDTRSQLLAEAPLAELTRRLQFLSRVGLGYLSLDRPARSLSGGEMQRLRLAAQLGAGLTGALYVLDEPTIGLHPRDTSRLVDNLRALVRTGSTVIVVEHDESLIRAADHLIDLGPVGGSEGGQIMAQGTPEQVLASSESPTAQALNNPLFLGFSTQSNELAPPASRTRLSQKSTTKKASFEHWLELRGARGHNLKNVHLKIPLGTMTVIAGVSGSGKSTLIRQVFYPALRHALGLEAPTPLEFSSLDGAEHVVRAVAVDQSPIGRTSRSTPATFLGIFDWIRKLYASTNQAQIRGFSATRFSFNSSTGGRCSVCNGAGFIVSEMTFLPDVMTPCEACDGTRYEPATLDCKYLGRSIAEVLALTARDAAQVFSAHPSIAKPLQILDDLGVGYITLGQASNTLSGGEAQRLKLAAELSEMSRHQPTVYVLDEPTTGLHIADVRKLIGICHRLIARGDTLVVIEHHPEIMAASDYLIELGPEGGAAGGRLIAEGIPQQIAKLQTPTAQVLRELDTLRTKTLAYAHTGS